MRTLFGFSTDHLLIAIGALVLLAVLMLGWAGWRNPVIPRLALRNMPRRPGWATLITLSLTLSTVILSSAFTTGDTMQTSVRAVVAGALGAADLVVFIPRPWRGSGADLADALATGTYLTGISAYFPEGEADRISALVAGDEQVAGLLPVVLDQLPAAAPGSGFRAKLNLLGLPDELPAGFGELRDPTGVPLPVAALAADEVYANIDAATTLDLRPGGLLLLYPPGGGEAEPVRVRAIAATSDVSGAPPALLLPLTRLQRLVGQPGQLNQILIAFRGTPADRLRAAWPLTVRLRAAFLDDATAARLFRTLNTPETRRAIEGAAARARGWPAEKLRRLVNSLAAGEPTPEFSALVQDPDVVGALAARFGGEGAPPAAQGSRVLDRGLRAAPAGPNAFRVLDVQQVAQDQADRWGSAFTDLFVVLGLFSLSTGLLLVVLVVALMALERRSELGVMRALGGRRRDVVLVLATEGALYSLLAASVGLVAGALLAYGLVTVAAGLIAAYGFRLTPSVEPSSLALSFGLGLVLTFLTVTTAAWRSSRFSIVAAVREQAPPANQPAGVRALVPVGLTLLTGLALLVSGLDRRWALAYTLGVVLVVVSTATFARWLLRRVGARRGERVVVSLAGLTLIGWWSVPPAWPRALGLPVFPPAIDLSVLSGLAMLLGAVWLVAAHSGLLRRLWPDSPLWRLSTAYLAAHPFRTGMTVAMFGLVVLSLTTGSILLSAANSAFSDLAAASGGWEIRADSTAPPRDPRPALAAGATSPSLFSGIGTTAIQPAEVIQTDAAEARWRMIRLTTVDAGFTAAIGTRLTGATGPERATWQELSRRPGTAIIGAALVGDSPGSARLAAGEGQAFRPFEVWLRDPRGRGPATRLTVIGLADPRGPFGRTILTDPASVADWAPPERATYYFALPPDANPRELAAGLSLSLPEATIQLIAQELRLVQGIRGLLSMILQGFMTTGLLAGVVALGIISLRASVERRRQFAVLRALGLPARSVGLGLLIESGVVALLGALVGVAIGLAVAQAAIAVLARQNPELRFSVPWDQLAMIVLVALAASLAMTLLPARQAARLAPAAALRTE